MVATASASTPDEAAGNPRLAVLLAMAMFVGRTFWVCSATPSAR
jgi:hypothetical protein